VTLLSMQGITKSFDGVKALSSARLEIERGEVMALIGQNGAGKSTLIKILTGVHRKDAGVIRFDGREVDFASAAESQAAGIATIYQEINLAPQRSVAENIFMAREPRRWGFLDRRTMRAKAREVLATFKLDIDVDRPMGQFSAATRQMVAIARAVIQNAKLVIMDEPTSSLDEREVAVLFKTVRSLKASGVSICFIGHRLDELYAVCNRVTVMRDGQTVFVGTLAEVPKIQLVRHMLGKELAVLEQMERAGAKATAGPARLTLSHARSEPRVRDVSLTVRQGEIAGLAGLLGSGRSETARIVFGVDPLEEGELTVKGRKRDYGGPAEAIADGMGFLPEDRKVDGIIPDMSIRENITLALLPKLVRGGIIDRTRQNEITSRFIKALDIKCASPEQPVRELSGGNQQKVLLARWLCTNPELLIIDEPTRGIDIGAKTEILRLLRTLADQGLSVLMVSSELEELLAVADHATVLSDGRSVTTLSRAELSEQAVMAAMAHEAN
jgi:galactofuranose transport system ATP-binding protein